MKLVDRIFNWLRDSREDMVVVTPSSVVDGALVKKVNSDRVRPIPLASNIGKIFPCEGKHPKRSWKDAKIVGITLEGYILERLERNADKFQFHRLVDQVAIEGAMPRGKSNISRRRRLQCVAFSAYQPAA